ncbi:MAG TPA: Ig-like domain-containing protein, partial [Acidobacteriota bacterium]|nr:Ig-like domain-containing protein [Acidobacteriota bacterium]
TDSDGLQGTQTFKLTVLGNTAPVISSLAPVNLAESQSLVVNVSATDAEISRQNVTLAISGQPSFVTLSQTDNGKGVISINPQVGQAGTYTVTVTARDSGTRTEGGTFNDKAATPVTFQITVTSNVSIGVASYINKRLFISGAGFGTTPTVTVNGKTVPSSLILAGSTDNSITAKGNRSSLGLRKGSNTIQVTGKGGTKSNVFTLNLATNEEAGN